ncbi:BNR/Asp-box repeat protein [Beggiatoa alba B18LD]|uniref:BNR/Asp-box repeat protein n=1 Tax=Beggiatoa alba B18LD TaxID=395493 RepID=I3CGB4_9GAMM|nr:hypothetical protein [Beggiatoa alba]EIJ42657.1 BNR/Asp-box repeat protein [Beggiatoa alba B18LD]
MHFYLRVLSLLSLFCLIVPLSWAGEDEWTIIDLPDGGSGVLNTRSLDTSTVPSRLILSNSYQSIDKGESWTAIQPVGFDNITIRYRKDPTADIWYGVENYSGLRAFYKRIGLYGEWVEVVADDGFTLPRRQINSGNGSDILAIAPTQPATIYACVTPITNDYNQLNENIYRSQDGGKRWYAIYSLEKPVNRFLARTLVVDPHSPNTLYILGQETTEADANGQYKYKLYTSHNAGDDWTETAHNILEAGYITSLSLLNTLSVVATTPTTLYLNTNNSTSPELFRTTITGNAWEKLPLPSALDRVDLVQDDLSIELIPSKTALYAIASYRYIKDNISPFNPTREDKLYKLNHDNVNWTELTSDLFPTPHYYSSFHYRYQLVIDPEDNNTLYLTTEDNILKSSDEGESWQLSKKGLKNRSVENLFSTPTTPYVLTNGELFQVTDKGKTWTNSNLLFPAIRFQTINTTLEATKVYGYTKDCKSLYVKQQGQEAVFHPLPTTFHLCSADKTQVILHTVPYDAKTLYAVVPAGNSKYSSVDTEQADKLTTPQILKSTDDGATWTTLYTLLNQRQFTLVPDPITPKTLYASVEALGIMRSIDDGTTWELLTYKFVGVELLDFKVLPTTPRTFLVVQRLGAQFTLISTDEGRNWVTSIQRRDNYYPFVLQAHKASENNYLLYSLMENILYKSSDMGDSWCPIAPSLSLQNNIHNFAIDSTENTFYARLYDSDLEKYMVVAYTPTTKEFINQLGAYNLTMDSTNNAIITGKIQRDSCETGGRYASVPLSATVEIQGSIEPLPEHVGQTADIIVYGAYYAFDSGYMYFMLGENTIQVRELGTELIPFKQGITLQAKNDISLYKGQFLAAGRLSIFFGYRLADGTVIVNEKELTVDIF